MEVITTNPDTAGETATYRGQISNIAQVEVLGGQETIRYFHHDHLDSLMEIAAKHHLTELRNEMEKLLNDIRAGKAFLPYYE